MKPHRQKQKIMCWLKPRLFGIFHYNILSVGDLGREREGVTRSLPPRKKIINMIYAYHIIFESFTSSLKPLFLHVIHTI